jgi:hypothetical protein
MPKEIEISRIRRGSYEDLGKPFVFEYKGRLDEIKNFVKLANDAGLNVKMSEDQSVEGFSQFKMTVPRKQFGKFMAVLHEWKIDI